MFVYRPVHWSCLPWFRETGS